MSATELRCLPLTGTTDGPIFVAKEGTAQSLTNMRLRPDGFAEARGGFDKLKPSGGSAVDAISAGAYSDIQQTNTSYGWVRTFDPEQAAGSQYTKNLQLSQGGNNPFNLTAIPATYVGKILYWGADDKFSRIMVSMAVAATAGTLTYVYEYWNGAAWSALTTAETIDWTVLRTPTFASWTLPTDWVASTIGDAGTGNVLKYWMRIRISAWTGAFTNSGSMAVARGFWGGMRELYAATQNPRSNAATGTLKRHGQTGTTEEWFPIDSTLFSAHASPARMLEYRGRLFLINGKEQKRWDGYNFQDIGVTSTYAPTAAAAAGGVLGAGIWRYYYAFGYGYCQNMAVYQDRQDAQALYGPSQAYALGEITTVAAQRVSFQYFALNPLPTGVSSIYLYRTDDLTNVPVGDRANAPAYMIQSLRIESQGTNFEQGLGLVGSIYYDDNLSYVFPLQEAKAFDVLPPSRCKYQLIYQNRLMLGDDETWYTSDPFFPDLFSKKSYNYIRLARASGGRHMGGVEFADQAVLYTEDQTWGLTSVDQDVPQLFPIHPTVGCIAPDAIATGDGRLMWPARDGVYTWDGDGRHLPRKVTGNFDTTLGKMSYETHGGSRGVIRDRAYILSVCAPGGTPSATYVYDMDTDMWSTWTLAGFTSTLAPLALIHAPLGNADAGGVHALWGKVDYGTGAGDYSLYLDELTTQDSSTNYNCSGVLYFKQPPGELFTPQQVIAYYQATDGWQAPTFTYAGGELGSSPGSVNTRTPDTGTDYSVVGGVFSSVPRGSSSLKVTFTVASQAGGTVNGQRLFGAVLKGMASGFRRGAP